MPASSNSVLAMSDGDLIVSFVLIMGNLFTVTGLGFFSTLLQESGLSFVLPVPHD